MRGATEDQAVAKIIMGSTGREVPDLVCPFCGYLPTPTNDSDLASYDLEHHVELNHREGGTGKSPFEVVADHEHANIASNLGNISSTDRPHSSTTSSTSVKASGGPAQARGPFVDCPRQCGESVPRDGLDQHMSLHKAEDMALADMEGHHPPDQRGSQASQTEIERDDKNNIVEKGPQHPNNFNKSRLRKLFSVSATFDKIQRKSSVHYPEERLGRKELGPHAWEEQMPPWLLQQLREGPPVTWINQLGPDGQLRRVERVANETSGIMPALAKLCRQDSSVSKAWLCSPGVKHIFKTRREGGFCGYRNIQMQVSWMQDHQHPGYQHFGTQTPNILDLQLMIENAWKQGFNSTGKAETGGIIGTRKYIGTPEAQALFQHLGIQSHADAFTVNKIADRREPVYAVLLQYIMEYFSQGVTDPSQKVYRTSLPPIYFQHPGHSLTIVGIEVHKNGKINLLVFDPMFATDAGMIKYLESGSTTSRPSRLLKAFRRGEDYLHKFRSFETLGLVLPGA